MYVQQGNGAIQFLNDKVFGNDRYGLYLQDGYQGAGISTIDGGAYYQQTGLYGGSGIGIADDTGSLIENVQVYANHGDGIYQSNNPGYGGAQAGTVTGNSVFGNGNAGIEASGAQITDNLVYSNISTTRYTIELDSYATATGNTVFGGFNGINVSTYSAAENNLVYDISGMPLTTRCTTPFSSPATRFTATASALPGRAITAARRPDRRQPDLR